MNKQDKNYYIYGGNLWYLFFWKKKLFIDKKMMGKTEVLSEKPS